MCLDTVTKRYAKPSKRAVKAWKLFTKGRRGEPTPLIWAGSCEEGKWHSARNPVERACDGEKYHAGFHAFARRRDAVEDSQCHECVRPVLLRGVRTVGSETGLVHPKHRYVVLVADELYIPTEERKAGAK